MFLTETRLMNKAWQSKTKETQLIQTYTTKLMKREKKYKGENDA